MFEENLALVNYAINLVGCGRSEYDDLFQVGAMALWRSIELYNPNKGTKFFTYALKSIIRKIKRHKRQDVLVHIPEEVLMNDEKQGMIEERLAMFSNIESLNAETEDGTEYIEFVGDECMNLDDKLAVRQALKVLKDREKRYILAKYYEDKPRSELVKMFGVSPQRLHVIEKEALAKMRRALCS